MTLTRRQFTAGLGAGLLMLPLTRRKAAASVVRPPVRLVFMTSVGLGYSDWAPRSAPGAAVQLNTATTGLASVVGDVMLIGGLPMPFLGENHGTLQHTTGLDFGTNYMGTSLETFVANALNTNTPQSSMLLGAAAKNGSSFKGNGAVLQTIDSPLDAFNLAFPAGAPSRIASTSYTTPRADIAALVQKRISALSSKVGAVEQQKLAMYAQSLAKISPAATVSSTTGTTTSSATTGTAGTTGATTGSTPMTTGSTTGATTTGTTGTAGGTAGTSTSGSAGCAPTTPNMTNVNPANAGSTAAVGQLHMQLIPSLFACDITRVVGLQWGTTSQQTVATSVNTSDEHSNWHSGDDTETARVAQENLLCAAMANMITTMKQTPDPIVSGTSVLDNTLVLWVRDIGNAPDHSQNINPVLMAGATGYLKYNGTGGTYYNLAGQGTLLNVLLSALEAMSVPFGSFGNPNGAQTGQALSAIKL